jgi:hypothetical protein
LAGDFTITADPHFLWITEFPLFTRVDEDKEFLAKGRWSSSHHPFTAPMWQDIEAMYRGDIEMVCVTLAFLIEVYLRDAAFGFHTSRVHLDPQIKWLI